MRNKIDLSPNYSKKTRKIKDIKLKGLYSLNNNLSDSYKIDLIQNPETLDFDANINLNNLFLNFKSLDYKKNLY